MSNKKFNEFEIENEHSLLQENPSNLAANLRKLLEQAKISEHELSRRTKIKQPIIHRILSGANKNPKLLTLQPIANYFMLSVSQLIGEKKIDTVWEGYTSNLHHGWVKVPVINVNSNEESKHIITEGNTGENIFALQLKDQSMEPVFPENCFVIVDTLQTATNGRYIALRTISNEIIIRHLILLKNNKFISPLNRKFGTISPFSAEDRILGIVIRTIYDHQSPN